MQKKYGFTLLQYVYDLLLTEATKEDCMKGTQLLLTLLCKAGYKVLMKEAQICQENVKYLGFYLTQGQGQLVPRGNRHSSQFQCLQPAVRLESFGVCWILPYRKTQLFSYGKTPP